MLLCTWLLPPNPSILAGLDQVMVPTAHCSLGHVAPTILLTNIVQVTSTPKTCCSGWTGSSSGTHCSLQYCMCGFYHLTHCNIVQVVSTLLLTVILCRWFLPCYSVILCRWFLPYYSLWYCAGGFYPTTHCDIVQVASTPGTCHSGWTGSSTCPSCTTLSILPWFWSSPTHSLSNAPLPPTPHSLHSAWCRMLPMSPHRMSWAFMTSICPSGTIFCRFFCSSLFFA